MADPQVLAQLKQHPGWQELYKVSEERMERVGKHLAYEFLTKDRQPDYGTLQYQRGFLAGMKFLLDKPAAADREFQRQLAAEREEVS